MTNYTLLQTVNEMCSGNMRKREEEEQIGDLELPEESTNVLSDEEVQRLVEFIREDLHEDGLQNDTDAVTEKAYLYVENIPGLEDSEAQTKAVQLILSKYFNSV